MDLRQAAQIMYPQNSSKICLNLLIDEMEKIALARNVYLRFTPITDHGDGVFACEFEVFYNTEEPCSDYFTTSLIESSLDGEVRIDDWVYSVDGFTQWLEAQDPRGR